MKMSPGGNPVMQHERSFFSHSKFTFSLLSFCFLLFTACDMDPVSPDQELTTRAWQSPDMVLTWNQAIQDLYTFPTYATSISPPLITRVMAMYHLAIHDALNCITPRYDTYVGVTRDKDADPDAAVAQAAYDMIVAVALPIQNLSGMTALLQTSLAGIPDGDAKTRGIALGHAVTQAILTHRSGDIPLVNTNYFPKPAEGNDPGEYRYIPPANYGLAGYHMLTPFFMQSNDQFLPGPPYDVNSPEYATDFNEIETLGSLTGSTRTTDQTELGTFWTENPNRSWNVIARSVMASRPPHSMDAWKTAHLLALMHAAVGDAFISAFDSKLHYYHWRPVSAIRLGDTDGNDATTGNPTWIALFSAPPVPGYPAANAIGGAAAGGVLIRFFNKDNFLIDTDCGYLPGVIRHYDSISDAVSENIVAKIYTGNYTRHANEVGEYLGYELADYIFENALQEK